MAAETILHSGQFVTQDDELVMVTFYRRTDLNAIPDSMSFGASGGTQTLEIVREYRDDLNVVAMAASKNVDLIEKQAREFKPSCVCMFDEKAADDLKARLSDTDITVFAGMAISSIISSLLGN